MWNSSLMSSPKCFIAFKQQVAVLWFRTAKFLTQYSFLQMCEMALSAMRASQSRSRQLGLKGLVLSIRSIVEVLITTSFMISASSQLSWAWLGACFPLKLMKPCSSRITSYWNIMSTASFEALPKMTSSSSSVCFLGNFSTSLNISTTLCIGSSYLNVCMQTCMSYCAHRLAESLSAGISSRISSICWLRSTSSLILRLQSRSSRLRISTCIFFRRDLAYGISDQWALWADSKGECDWKGLFILLECISIDLDCICSDNIMGGNSKHLYLGQSCSQTHNSAIGMCSNEILLQLDNQRISMQRGKIRNFPQYTHFACLPFVQQPHRNTIKQLQVAIRDILSQQYEAACFEESNHLLSHITICMLVLHREEVRKQMSDVITKMQEEIASILRHTTFTFKKVSCFTRSNSKNQKKEVTLLYLQLQKDQHFRKIEKVTDVFIRQMLACEIITPAELKQMRISYDHNTSLYTSEENHLTLFRVNSVPLDQKFQQAMQLISQIDKFQPFECLSFDISTRKAYSQNHFYTPFLTIPLTQLK